MAGARGESTDEHRLPALSVTIIDIMPIKIIGEENAEIIQNAEINPKRNQKLK